METPQRQIRAVYTDDTITVYQAYSPAIALPAVARARMRMRGWVAGTGRLRHGRAFGLP